MKHPTVPRKACISEDPADLRRRAEDWLGGSRGGRQKAGRQKSEADTERMLHELEVHQIELELQNAELRKARDELEVALEKYTDLYDFAPVGYFSIDESGVILEANLTSTLLLGVERSRLVNRRLVLFLAPTSRPLFLAFLRKIFGGHKDQICEALLLKEGGGTFWASFRARSAIAPQGGRKWCRLAVFDIAARKQVEGALRESEKRYCTLFKVVPAAIYSCNASGVIQEFNDQAAKLWGRTPASGDTNERFCGSFKWFRPDGRSMPHDCPMAEVVSGKIPEVRDAEVLIERPDGSRITVAVNICPLKNERGEFAGAINCFYDITERKQAAERIRISEVRYRRLFETAHDGILLLDPDTCRITDANPFLTRLLGYSHQQLVGKELFEIGLLKDKAACQEMFQQLKRKHEVRYPYLPLEAQKGRNQEVEVVASLYRENGRTVIQCNIRDITARKQEEMALQRLAAIVESSDDAIIGKDPNGIITSWNKGAERIFGYTAREMVGVSIMRLIPNARRNEEKFILGKIRRGEKLEHFETLRQTKDGRLIDISVTVSPIKDATGKVVGASKVARDITALKNAERALRESERRFREMIDVLPAAIYTTDAAGLLTHFNPAAIEFSGRVPQLGTDHWCVTWKLFNADGSPLPHEKCPMAIALKGRRVPRGVEVMAERPDGTRVWFTPYPTPLRDSKGRIVGGINMLVDITERKKAEGAQRRMNALMALNRKLKREILRRQAVEQSLKQSEQQQSQLLEQSRHMQNQLRELSRRVLCAQEEERKRISRELHDVIAQTLTSINVRLAVLKEEARSNIKGLDQSITRTQQLVEHSVDIVHRFARELRPTVLDDLGLIPALQTFMKTFTEETGVRVSLSASAAVEAVNGDKRTVLYRVAQEALTNIARHAQAHRAEVKIEKLQGAVRMTIKDDGKGFETERVLHVKKNRRLGMVGMKERLEMVGGNFTITSAPGKGTTVLAQIPLI